MANGDDTHPWPWGSSFSFNDFPVTLKDLIGKKCRVVRYGDAVTEEYVPGRITLFLDADSRIADIRIEPASGPLSDTMLEIAHSIQGGLDIGGG